MTADQIAAVVTAGLALLGALTAYLRASALDKRLHLHVQLHHRSRGAVDRTPSARPNNGADCATNGDK